MQGQGLEPRGYHPFADLRPAELVEAFLRDTEDVVRRCVAAMPLHADFVAATCSATP